MSGVGADVGTGARPAQEPCAGQRIEKRIAEFLIEPPQTANLRLRQVEAGNFVVLGANQVSPVCYRRGRHRHVVEGDRASVVPNQRRRAPITYSDSAHLGPGIFPFSAPKSADRKGVRLAASMGYEAEMSAIRHILFPYDFSARCDDIVPFVRSLAQQVHSRITLLSVAPPGEAGEAIEALQRRLDRALPDAFPGLIVERVADAGDAAYRITDFSERRSVDLVMLPTHGLGLFRTMLIGSVTAKVLHDVTCPVWTAAHAVAQTALPLPRTIVCALDDSAAGAALARCAEAFAGCVSARLQLLHAVGPISDLTALESERRLQERVREQTRAQILERLQAVGVTAPLRVAVGGVVQTIVEEARQEGADLIVLGRGSVAEPFGRLRTHAFGIIHRAPCPVISV